MCGGLWLKTGLQAWKCGIGWSSWIASELFGVGDRWTQCRIACVAGGIRSTSEQCNDFSELLDKLDLDGPSQCGMGAAKSSGKGSSAWWEKQLQNVKIMNSDVSFTLLILLTWGSKNCLVSLARLIGTHLGERLGPSLVLVAPMDLVMGVRVDISPRRVC